MGRLKILSYKDKLIIALTKKGILDCILNKDVTADIVEPELYLIDSSGNVIKSDNGDDSLTII